MMSSGFFCSDYFVTDRYVFSILISENKDGKGKTKVHSERYILDKYTPSIDICKYIQSWALCFKTYMVPMPCFPVCNRDLLHSSTKRIESHTENPLSSSLKSVCWRFFFWCKCVHLLCIDKHTTYIMGF